MRVARATRRRCGWAHGVEEPEGIAAHYVEGAGASTHSHSEWIVGRSSAFMNHPGLGARRPAAADMEARSGYSERNASMGSLAAALRAG